MKDTIVDANFPRTKDGRAYHLGLRYGEVANRIVTVGDPGRARLIAQYLDSSTPNYTIQSERGFLTITGKYKGTPISICAIGMGIASCDFFVRETRECVSGDMAIIRLGSCGSLIPSLIVGSLVVPKACVAITRNYDFDFTSPVRDDDLGNNPAYRISKPVSAHPGLHAALTQSLHALRPADNIVVNSDIVNAAADSFYSSQGRITSFPDRNEGLIDTLMQTVPGVATMEMESHHLFHLASVYTPYARGEATSNIAGTTHTTGSIHACAAQMVFAQRNSKTFIIPEQVKLREQWAGQACLEALATFFLEHEHPPEGAVWTRSRNDS